MADHPVDMVDGEMDRFSGLPDDVLLDILGRLVTAGDVRTVAKTSILSRRWRSLPWRQITNVSLDVGYFFPADSSENPWVLVRRGRRQRFWDQHEATAGFTAALANFLADPPSKRIIQKLSLKFILTKRDLLCRIGNVIVAGTDAGASRTWSSRSLTEITRVPYDFEGRTTRLGYGERFKHLACSGAFRCLTKLTLRNLCFDDPDMVNNLVRRCNALEFLFLSACGLYSRAIDDDDGDSRFLPWPVLSIDAPQSRLQYLLCDSCHIGGVQLVQAPALVALRYSSVIVDDNFHLISFWCAPSLKGLCLDFYQSEESVLKLKLSELLVNCGRQIEWLCLVFNSTKVRT